MDKRNFYIGATFLMLAVFSFSLLPILIKKIDFFFIFNMAMFKDCASFFAIIAIVFWLNSEGHFKKQIIFSLILGLFYIITVGIHHIINYP